MKHRGFALIAGVLAWLTPNAALAQSPMTLTEQAIAACRAKEADAERLACYDRIADVLTAALGEAPAAPAVAVAPPPPLPAPEPAPAAPRTAEVTPPPASKPKQVQLAPTAPAAPATPVAVDPKQDSFGFTAPQREKRGLSRTLTEEVSSTITKVTLNNRSRAVVTLANGQVWRSRSQNQSQNRRFVKLVGSDAVITSAVVSGYVLKIPGTGRSLRVERID